MESKLLYIFNDFVKENNIVIRNLLDFLLLFCKKRKEKKMIF